MIGELLKGIISRLGICSRTKCKRTLLNMICYAQTMKPFSKKNSMVLIMAAAVGLMSAIFMAASSNGNTASISTMNTDGEVDYLKVDPNLPFWNEDWTKTGNSAILALEIASQESNFKEVKYGKLHWLDAAIDNVGSATPVEDIKIKEFMKYTADGNTDFKVELPDKSEKFYRLYFVEVP